MKDLAKITSLQVAVARDKAAVIAFHHMMEQRRKNAFKIGWRWMLK